MAKPEMLVETTATSQDLERYIVCINNLAIRLSPYATINPRDELNILLHFFALPQTGMSREGVLCLLNAIRNYNDYIDLVTVRDELVQVYITFNGANEYDRSGEGPYTFFYFVYKNPSQAIELLKCAADFCKIFGTKMHSVLEYLFRLGKFYVTGDSRLQPNEGRFMSFFFRRAYLFQVGFREIYNHLTQLSYQLPIHIRMADSIFIPTTGDMHCNGKIPYFIEYEGQKFVYKPRNMRADFFVVSAFAYFNTFLPEELQLPIFQIYLLPDDTGFMEFVPHAKTMSKDQAKSFFLKFGVLLCFSKLLGVQDLHYENIMATIQGPVIIDMECSLNIQSIKTKSISNDSLGLTKFVFSNKKMENVTFSINGVIPSLGEWSEYIVRGFAIATQCCQVNKQDFINCYTTILQQSFYYRITPISTGDFYGNMFYMVLCHTNTNAIQSSLNDFCNQIIDSLYMSFSHLLEKEEFLTYIHLDFLMRSIYTALFSGNIPFLQVRLTIVGPDVQYMAYVDNNPFFTRPIIVGTVATFAGIFGNQIDWLNSSDALDAVKAFIG